MLAVEVYGIPRLLVRSRLNGGNIKTIRLCSQAVLSTWYHLLTNGSDFHSRVIVVNRYSVHSATTYLSVVTSTAE